MKRIFICLALLVLAITLSAALGDRLAQEGRVLFQNGEYQQALGKYLAADRAADGTVPEYHYWLGRLYSALGDASNTLVWLRKYIQSNDQQYRPQAQEQIGILERQGSIFTKAELRSMPGSINSSNSDFGAIVDPTGKYLWFTSLRPALFAKENIWRAEITPDGFGAPELVKELSTDKNESLGSFSLDGSTAWLFGNFAKDKLDGDIYYLELGKGGATPVNATQFNSSQVDTQPMAFRNSLLFFASSRAGGFGGTDIYVAEKIGGLWSDPINLGAAINTAGNEQTPFLDQDGQTLYFASSGHPGFGGYDIFKACKFGPGWADWSIPENLGLPINSVRNDRYFFRIPATNQGFISSDRVAADYEKIYQLTIDRVYPPSYLLKDSSGNIRTVEITPPRAAEKLPASTNSVLDDINKLIWGLEKKQK